MTTVRTATEDDVDGVARSMAKAFVDDPVMRYVFGERDDIERRLTTFFGVDARRHLQAGHDLYTTDTRSAAAYWAPPGQWRTPLSHALRTAPVMLRLMGRRLLPALAGLAQVEKRHPEEPHWYLAALGTDPSHQGRGHGGAVLAPVLERCDREGLPAYLESSKERNVPYYRRFGFEVTEAIPFGKGPLLWGMWRDPR